MYLRADDEYADREMQLMSEVLATIDSKLAEVLSLIAVSADPESDGLTDRGEYFIGVGFSVIQQYLTDTLTFTGVSKKRALDIGPRYSEKFTVVAVVNAAANWWKHSAEWVGRSVKDRVALKTQEIVSEVANTEDYPMRVVLSELQNKGQISLGALLPNLVLWRSAVDRERQQNA